MSVVNLGGNVFPSVVNVKVGQTVRRYVPEPCDRERLLELAEDVDGAAEDSGGFEPLAGMLHDIARRIREACGEGD